MSERAEYQRAYRLRNRILLNKYHKEYSQTLKGRYAYIKAGAKQRNKVFNITLQEYADYFYNKQCFYCNRQSDGIDRVNSDQDYIQGNCIPCCGVCNTIKMDLSFEDFIDLIGMIYHNLS